MAAKWLKDLKARLRDKPGTSDAMRFEKSQGTGGATRDETLKRLGLPPDKETGDKPV
jgi:hypothetical protein